MRWELLIAMPSSHGDGSRCVDFLLVASCSQQRAYFERIELREVGDHRRPRELYA
jgi:hypothetical protein